MKPDDDRVYNFIHCHAVTCMRPAETRGEIFGRTGAATTRIARYEVLQSGSCRFCRFKAEAFIYPKNAFACKITCKRYDTPFQNDILNVV